MSLSLSYRFARRELRGGLRGFRIFLACLALGVMAIAAVGTVRSSITAGLERESAALLGGDAEVGLTYRFASEAERAWMESIADTVSETVDFRSMLVVTRDTVERGLTQVMAVDSAYPLIGSVTLDPAMPLDAALAGVDGTPGIVVERVLAERMGVVAGDTVRLGTQDFVLTAILAKYPDNAAGGFGLGPRSIVLTRDLANSGLLAAGTLMDTNYRLKLPEGSDLAALEQVAQERFRDTGMRWRDSRDGARGVERFVDRLGSFLVLVGLSGLAVGGVGVSAAVRSYLTGKTEVIATLKTLGATRRVIFQTYFIQIGILTLFGVGLGILMGALIPLLFAPMIAAQLPIPVEFAVYPRPLIEAGIYGLITAALFTLWPLAPRVYCTDYAAMEHIDIEPVRAEWDLMMRDFELDKNRGHFKQNYEYDPSILESDPELKEEFLDLLVSSITAEYSGCVLYQEIEKNVSNPDVSKLMCYMARDESRHAGFINKALNKLGGSTCKKRSAARVLPAAPAARRKGLWRSRASASSRPASCAAAMSRSA
uniref:ferritin family protein n=1 Tax=Marivivens sp. TaxID=1978374 RepID=UPI0025C70022